MPYTLAQFCDDTRAALNSGQPLDQNLEEVAGKLRLLLTDPDFIAATFKADAPPGKEELYHDPDLDFYVLAHVQKAGKGGTPHTHGTSWAIYGNARGYTEMTEWRRVNPETEEGAVLEVSDRYRIEPGGSRAYGPGAMHSTAHPEPAWVIRVTGTDLDVLPRYKFRKSRDRMLEKA